MIWFPVSRSQSNAIYPPYVRVRVRVFNFKFLKEDAAVDGTVESKSEVK
jgi:hypothetical protein